MVQKSKHYKNVCIENLDSHACEMHFTPSPSLIPVRRAEHTPVCPQQPSFMFFVPVNDQ